MAVNQQTSKLVFWSLNTPKLLIEFMFSSFGKGVDGWRWSILGCSAWCRGKHFG